MEATTEVKTERRRSSLNLVFSQVSDVLVGRQSRKVAAGIWLEIISTTLLRENLIDSHQWMICTYISMALIGFGTIVDSLINKFADVLLPVVGQILAGRVVGIVPPIKKDEPAQPVPQN